MPTGQYDGGFLDELSSSVCICKNLLKNFSRWFTVLNANINFIL